ncbi:MAG: HD domain-containing protein [Candidatus Aenigmarchaeota archaeon]|nr:HD domain-containing protein [Candidatus Aenigmarchaeota archaeon]
MINEKLLKQIDFIREVDKLKTIFRQSYIINDDRKENDAEHSWHLSLMAVILSEYANENIDILKVLKMILVHDLVEIDAVDTFCYDKDAASTKKEREEKAADRIFSLLPPEQGKEIRSLWEEFENRSTPEAKFAAGLDRLQPLLMNYGQKGKTWKEHNVTSDRVLERNKHMKDGSTELWEFAENLIKDAVEKGYLDRTRKC